MTQGADAAGLHLLALMVQRMGHDLSSPLGALVTALDLAETPDPLVAAAVDIMARRLSLWRALLAPSDEPVDWKALTLGLRAEAARRTEVGLDLAGIERAGIDDLPPRAVRAAAALTLQALGLLAGPGLVATTPGEDRLLIRATGPIAAAAEALGDVLAGLKPADRQLAPAAYARALGLPIRQERMPDALVLSIGRATQG